MGWWRSRSERELDILAFLLTHGEAPGRVIAKGANISRVNIYLDLWHMEDAKLVSSRDDPADDPLEHILGARRRLYRLETSGRRRLIERDRLSAAANGMQGDPASAHGRA